MTDPVDEAIAAAAAVEVPRMRGRFPLPTMEGEPQRSFVFDLPADFGPLDFEAAVAMLFQARVEVEQQRAAAELPKPRLWIPR